MNDICMMSLTRDQVAERTDYKSIKASFDRFMSSIDEKEDAHLSICTSEGTCLFIDKINQLYNIKLGIDHNENYQSFKLAQVEMIEVERALHIYCTYDKSQLIQVIQRQNL